ncbi:MAG TPA: hypothetical protein VHE60_10835, partial [Pyrinomonadaceae bacterium]|nr:hypothetical protein [Pyrinomonadaceae bacterium]
MKRCPTCNRIETDDALKFCRHDGAPLVDESSATDDSATRLLSSAQQSAQVPKRLINTSESTAATSVL